MIGLAFLADQRQRFVEIRRQALWILSQLSDEEVHWRPGPESRSIGNLVAEVCGSLTQLYVTRLGGAPDAPEGANEFAPVSERKGEEVQWLIDSTFKAIDEVLAGISEERLLEEIHVGNGRREMVLQVICQGNAQAAEHLGQILYIAQMRLGPRLWPPA